MSHNDIYVNVTGDWHRFDRHEVLLIEAQHRYSKIITDRGTYIMDVSLKRLEDLLDEQYFCRIHRSFIIPFKRINYVTTEVVNLGTVDVPIGREFSKNFLTRLNFLQ